MRDLASARSVSVQVGLPYGGRQRKRGSTVVLKRALVRRDTSRQSSPVLDGYYDAGELDGMSLQAVPGKRPRLMVHLHINGIAFGVRQGSRPIPPAPRLGSFMD